MAPDKIKESKKENSDFQELIIILPDTKITHGEFL